MYFGGFLAPTIGIIKQKTVSLSTNLSRLEVQNHFRSFQFYNLFKTVDLKCFWVLSTEMKSPIAANIGH